MAERILIVDNDDMLCESLKRVLSNEGYVVGSTGTAESALKLLDEMPIDLIITEIMLQGIDGIELLKRVRERFADLIVILMTTNATLDTALKAIKVGAYDYLLKPLMYEEIKQSVKNALIERSLRTENIILKKEIIKRRSDFEKIVGESSEIIALIDEVKKIADSKSNVLLLGETGTGKELFAKAIHYNSSRADKPFIPINCSAIPENLLESELFGYARGAFTGASTQKKGLFEAANGGTLFLDEIGDLSPTLQAKLLRVMDDHEIRPLGSIQTRKIDIRFITATNRDIIKEVREGRFREDLFYRINVVTLKLPSLRERKGDVKILAEYFFDMYSHEIGKPLKFIDETAMRLLMEYQWPGNVRELQNIIERAVLLADSDAILPEHLPEELRKKEHFTPEAIKTALSIEEYTKGFILKHQSECSEQKLAEMLGITRKALWEKRKKWGIRKE
jgi:DNA-binding NtrC family response regulator